ncbi:MAG: glycosyltransferase family 92 protein, partial [Microcoleaceae cyanobacterium]
MEKKSNQLNKTVDITLKQNQSKISNNPCSDIEKETSHPTIREKCKLSICAIMKNEGPYLAEWLEFHKIVGVERFYLYNNNSTDNTLEILRPYIEKGEVILTDWPTEYEQQNRAYRNCLKKFKKESEWIAFIDLDEFIFPTQKDDLREILEDYQDYPALGVNWLIFGTSGHINKPEGLQIENFTKRAENEWKANLNFKSIVRSESTIDCNSPHHFVYREKGVAINENYEELLGKISHLHSVEKIRINHYFTRSLEEAKSKIRRGNATGNAKSKRKFSSIKVNDRNEVEDLTIQRFVPRVKAALNRTENTSIDKNAKITNKSLGSNQLIEYLNSSTEEQSYSPNKKREKCKLSICAIMKDEGPYLIEWLEFHKLVGVEKFYLYDNDSTDNTKEIISSYIDSGEVIYCYWPQRPGQMPAYSHCLENHKQESEWIAFIDLDEFLFPTKGEDIKEILDEFVEAPALAVNWLLFGTSNHETKPEGLQIENFIKRSKNNHGPNKTVKCIVHPEETVKPVNPHHFIYLNGLAVTENKQPVNGAFSPKHSIRKLRINHYHTRSKEESRRKMMRGRATKNEKRDWSHFESKEHIFNEVKDLSIQRFIPKLKKAIKKVNICQTHLQKTSQTANLSNPLIPTSPQSKEFVATQGNLDKSLIQNQELLLVGWVASINSGPVDGFKVAIAGQEITKFDLTLGLPSPGVKKSYSHLDNADQAKFRLKLPIDEKQQEYQDSLIALTPLFNNREGGLILAVKDPSLPIPSTEYIKNFGGVNSKEFIASGFKWLSYLIQRVNLKPADHILDVGCGLGNIAYALTSYLKSSGRYEGFDMVNTPLKWLQQEISTRKPNFKFRFVDVYHPIYYPKGNVPVAEFIFPYPDESFDVICLRDIFTHLQTNGVRQYLREISRVLKPGGKCLFSCFLLNSESEDLIVKGKSSKKLVHEIKDCFTTNPKKPEVTIGYQESYLQKLIREQDLNAISKYYGSWCGRVSFTKADLLILQKNSTSNPQENQNQESKVESKSQLQQMKKSLNHYQKKLEKIQKQVTEAPQQ